MNVREAAIKTLYAVEYGGAYSNMAVKETLRGYEMKAQDKAFFTRLVYGVVDKKLTLDYIIERHSKIKLKKLSKYILLILRTGIYQLKFMDKIPESATVNESVKLARKYGHGASAGYVNALLRNAAKSDIEYPKEKTEYLSVRYSYPEEQCKKWINDFGEEFTEAMMAAFEKPSPITIRNNSLKISAAKLAEMLAERGIDCDLDKDGSDKEGLMVSGGFDISKNELYLNGFFTPQSAAAMNASIVLAPKPGERVIDMCAAPGAKTTHMAEIMGNKGEILAFDIHRHKIDLIEKNAKRLGITIIRAKQKDASVFDSELTASADKILCDVPCSGHGIIGKKPDIKWSKTDNSGLTQIQAKILNNAAKYVKPGGDIVYSTCTIEREENENITGAFLKANSNFDKIYEKTYYPNVDNTDGFYICKLRKL